MHIYLLKVLNSAFIGRFFILIRKGEGMNTGERIRKIRVRSGISQYELARKVNHLNQSQISKIEKGQRRINDIDLVSISEALKVDISELLKED
ncbi:putative transcriptional regulator [Gottschalkia purinilytica]|uniref:Putative transcriptional regulator n=2 Tax=Gottschalkia purinilytica TaxID=1503 RepID=A0A0L0W666_GOTPU|nr:putative transcriptional regulator [Gottschalkia purinilytica]